MDDGYGGFYWPLLLGWNYFLDRQLHRLRWVAGGLVLAPGWLGEDVNKKPRWLVITPYICETVLMVNRDPYYNGL